MEEIDKNGYIFKLSNVVHRNWDFSMCLKVKYNKWKLIYHSYKLTNTQENIYSTKKVA